MRKVKSILSWVLCLSLLLGMFSAGLAAVAVTEDPTGGYDSQDSYENTTPEDGDAVLPTTEPTAPSEAEPTDAPEVEPTDTTEAEPTETPEEPTDAPETEPTDTTEAEPTDAPETEPTDAPETEPTDAPETEPTDAPEAEPTDAPETEPTEEPEDDEPMPLVNADEINAFLYANGEFVIIKGEAPADRGAPDYVYPSVSGNYSYNTGSNKAPWFDQRTDIRSVTFLTNSEGEKVQPTGLAYWFNGCSNLETVDTTGLDTSKVTSLEGTFYNCSALTTLDVSGWNTGKVKSLRETFYACRALTALNVSSWDTSSVTSLEGTFYICSSLTTLDVSNWKTGNVTTFSKMFYGCTALQSVNMSGWTLSALTGLTEGVFYNCASLTEVDMSGWTLTGTASFATYNWFANSSSPGNLFFGGCPALRSVNMSGWNTTQMTAGGLIKLEGMFYRTEYQAGTSSLSKVDMSGWTTAGMGGSIELTATFYRCPALTEVDMSGWDGGAGLISLDRTFSGSTALTTVKMDGLNLSSLVNMDNAFDGCTALTTLNTGSWTLSSLETMNYAFNGCTALTTLDVSNWGLGALTSMNYAFNNCTALTALNGVGNWTLGSLQTMDYAFYSCFALEELGTTNWNTATVTSMTNAFNPSPNTFVLGENFDFVGSDAISPANWKRQDAETVYTHEQMIGNEAPAGTYVKTDDVLPGGWIYVVLYDDGELVFQRAATTEQNRNLLDGGPWYVDTFTAYRTSTLPWWNNRAKVTKITFKDEIAPVKMDYWFHGMTNTKLDNSEVFAAGSKLVTSSVTSLSYTFYQCADSLSSPWSTIDLSNWDLRNLEDLSYTFGQNRYLTKVDFGTASLSNVKTMECMFRSTGNTSSISGLKELDTSNWRLDSLKSMDSAFTRCTLLTTLDASNWGLSQVTTMNNAFFGCTALTTLDTSSWDLSQVINMNSTFNGCAALTTLDAAGWKLENCTTMNSMFADCSSLTKVTNLKVTGTTTQLQSTFSGCSSLESVDTSNWNLSGATTLTNLFNGCAVLTTLDTSGWNLSRAANISSMFRDCGKLTQLNTLNWNLSDALKDMSYAFYGTGGLEVIDASNWNLSKVGRSMTQAFWPAPKKLILGPDVKFNAGATPIASAIYLRESTKDTTRETYTSEELYTQYTGEMADTYTLVEYDPSGYFFVMLYSDGELVFQYDGNPEPGRTLVRKYQIDVSLPTTANAASSSVPWFGDRELVRSVTFKDPIAPIYMDGWFHSMSNLMDARGAGSVNTANLDTSKVQSMSHLFYNCGKLTALDTSGWNLNAVTNMKYAFYHCSNLASLNVSGWGLSSVTTLECTFYQCTGLTMLDTGNWNLDNLADMHSTFYYCSSLQSLGTGKWTLPKVTDIAFAFNNCPALTTLDTGNWTLESVINMTHAFDGCSSLTTLNTAGWQLGNVTNMSYAFRNCSNLVTIDTSSWDTHSVKDMSYLFSGCASLNKLVLSGWDVSAVTTMAGMFHDCLSLTALDIDGWTTTSLQSLSSTFEGCTGLTVLELGNWDTSKVTSMSSAFAGCTSLFRIGADHWDLNAVTSMQSTFDGCSALYDINTSGWAMPKVISIRYLFRNCSSLTTLETGSWDFSRVASTGQYGAQEVFNGCSSLTTLQGMGNWNLSYPTSLADMFTDCKSLRELDVSNWNSSKVTSTAFSVGTLTGVWKVTLWKDAAATKDILYLGGQDTQWFEEGYPDVLYKRDEMIRRNKDQETAGRTYYRIMRVDFDPQGGIVDGSRYVDGWKAGDPIDTLPSATRRGYDFLGWFTQPEGGEEIHDGDPLWQTTYYAHWQEHHYTLVLLSNDNTDRENRYPLAFSDFFILSATEFTRDFYEIVGWNTRPDGSGDSFGPSETVLQLTGDDNGYYYLYAQWESSANMVTVSFDTGDGTPVSDIRVKRGGAIGQLPVTSKPGYTFIGWHLGSLDGELVDENTVINGDVTLVAEFKAHLTVRFFLNRYGEGDWPTDPLLTRQVPYNTPLGALPADPFNGTYGALKGWFTAATGGTQVDENLIITENMDLFGQWGWRPKLNANGGQLPDGYELPIQDDPYYEIDELPTPTRDGYEFAGWVGPDGKPVGPGYRVDLSNGAEFVAQWERAGTVTLILDPDGGEFKGTRGEIVKTPYMLEVYADIPVTELPTPTRTGYEFAGWKDLSTGEIVTRDSSFSQDTTLQAQWKEKSITIRFHRVSADARFPNYVSTVDTITVTVPYGSTLDTLPGCNALAGSSLDGYYLQGWYPDAEYKGVALTRDTVFTEDTYDYYAKWDLYRTTNQDGQHQYTYGAYWSTQSSTQVDNTGYDLQFHPTGNDTQHALLHVYFQLDNVEGYTGTLPAGAVQIKVPKYAFEGWNGEPVGACNVPELLTEFPEKGESYFSYIDMGDYYLLVNTEEFRGTLGITIDIDYSVKPSQVKGGATDKDGRYVDPEQYPYSDKTIEVEFRIDEEPDNKDNEIHSLASVDLNVEMHTMVEAKAEKRFSGYVYSWKDSWGPKPEDADDYFYIEWSLSEKFTDKTTQPSKYRWSEDVTVHDGTVVYITEDRWHEEPGGESISHNTTVVTKHPMSLLRDIPASGRTIYNEAIVTEVWKSGYQTESRVSASVVLHDDEYPTGEFDKRHAVSGTNWKIQGGQEFMLQDGDELNMPWTITYKGGSNYRPVWDAASGTYIAEERTIRIQDGVTADGEYPDGKSGDLMYSSGNNAAKYIWLPGTGNIMLGDDDYYFTELTFTLREYDARYEADETGEGGAWTKKTVNTSVDLYDTIDVYVRYRGTTELVLLQQINYAQQQSITLPANVAGFEVRHNSSFYWTELTMVAGMKLVPTQAILALLQNDVDLNVTSIIKNVARCDIWTTAEGEESTFFHATNYTGDNQDAQKQEYELNQSKTRLRVYKNAASEDNTVYDPATGVQTTVMNLYAVTYNTASGHYTKMTSGVFYDLLPTGNTVDPATVVCVPGYNSGSSDNHSSSMNPADRYSYYASLSTRLPSALVDVRFEEDWGGTGRTMMIITYVIDESLVPAGQVPDSIDVLYKMNNDNIDVRERGTSVENDVAFVNTTPNHPRPESTSGDITSIADVVRDSYQGLLQQFEGDIGFAKANTNYKTIAVSTWGFSKSVQTDENHGFVAEDATQPNRQYTYRLLFRQSSDMINSDIVFFDVLENGVLRRSDGSDVADTEVPSDWLGEFVSASAKVYIKDTNKNSAQCAPVIYYSGEDRSTFDMLGHEEWQHNPREAAGSPYRLDSGYWTRDLASLSEITAIAVDCTKDTDGEPFFLKGEAWIIVDIVMQAPAYEEWMDEVEGGVWARNEGIVCAYQGAGESARSTVEYSDAEVVLKDVNPGVEKTADPESGTEEEPTIVKKNQYVDYDIAVTNTDDTLTLYDMVVVDTVPDGMTFSTEDILVYFDSAPNLKLKISQSPRAKVVREGQKLTFTVSTLLPGETIHFVVPVLVTVEQRIFENHVEITEVEGREKHIEAKPTWHEVVPSTQIQLNVNKVLQGRNTKPIEPGEFTFELKLISINGQTPPEEKAYTDTKSTAENKGGFIEFDLIEYEADAVLDKTDYESVYIYSITEVPGDDITIDYAEEPVYARVTVAIVDDPTAPTEPGQPVMKKMTATVEYCTMDENGQLVPMIGVTVPEIVNQYFVRGEAPLQAVKNLHGRAKAPEKDEFTFTAVLVDNDTYEPVTDGAITLNGATTGEDGQVVFDKLIFDQDDVGSKYTYKITEFEPADDDKVPGVTYSEQVYYAVIEVGDLDAETGQLRVTVTYYDSKMQPLTDALPTFDNVYGAEGMGKISGTKTLTGRALQEGEFIFAVLDADGHEISTAKNNADGTFTIEYIGKYEDGQVVPFSHDDLTEETGPLTGYKLVERVPTPAVDGISYDDNEYELLITVEDKNGDGKLTVTVKTVDDVEAAFVNSFAGRVILHKVDENGKPLSGAEFRLYVWDDELNDWRVYANDSADGRYAVDKDGLLTVTGLAAGKYYFVETKAPAGYTIAMGSDGNAKRYEFTIGIGAEGSTVVAKVELEIENTPTPSETTKPTEPGSPPKTGDNDMPGLWLALLAMSMAGIVFTLTADGRKRKHKYTR